MKARPSGPWRRGALAGIAILAAFAGCRHRVERLPVSAFTPPEPGVSVTIHSKGPVKYQVFQTNAPDGGKTYRFVPGS